MGFEAHGSGWLKNHVWPVWLLQNALWLQSGQLQSFSHQKSVFVLPGLVLETRGVCFPYQISSGYLFLHRESEHHDIIYIE